MFLNFPEDIRRPLWSKCLCYQQALLQFLFIMYLFIYLGGRGVGLGTGLVINVISFRIQSDIIPIYARDIKSTIVRPTEDDRNCR